MPLTQVSPGLLDSNAQYYGFKNRIINGAMVIDQRNAGAAQNSLAGSATTYLVDRWYYFGTQASKFNSQQNAGSVTPPVGFTKYLGLTSTSAYSVVTSDYFNLRQAIEGFNVADLGFGTANASTVTFSFWVRSSLTGTFSGVLSNTSFNRVYPFTFTISSANTWEQKSVTVAGDTSGTWATDNTAGLILTFNLGAGATYLGTAGAWTSSTLVGATGSVNVVGTNGATFYITGVQLEKGSTATSFDYRPYTTELQLCQRYFEMSYDQGTAVGASTDNGAVSTRSPQGDMQDTIQFAVEKRAAPTITYYTTLGVSGSWRDITAATNRAMSNPTNPSSRQFSWQNANTVTIGNVLRGHWTASIEL